MIKFRQKAEGILEYVFIMGAISLALTTMNVYVKRGIQARIRDITHEHISQDQFISNGNSQTKYSSGFTTTTLSPTTTNLSTQGAVTTIALNENIQRRGTETYIEPQNYWSGPFAPTIPQSRGQPEKPIYPTQE